MGIRSETCIARVTLLLALVSCMAVPGARGAEVDLSGAVRQAQDAGVPPPALNRLLAMSYEHGLKPGEVEGLLREVMEAQKEGFPLQPFMNKMEEGLAKRVAPSGIVEVLEKKADDYRFTRSLLEDRARRQSSREPPAPVEVQVRLAELLNAGLVREDMRKVVDDFPAVPLPELVRGVELLAVLRQNHVDPALAGQIVGSGLKRDYFTAERHDFGRMLAVAKRRGLSDEELATAALAVIESNAPTSRLGSLLGVSASDLGSRGPQVGGPPPGRGSRGGGYGPGPGGWGGGGHGGRGHSGEGGVSAGGGSGSGGGSGGAGGGGGSGAGGSGGGSGGSGGAGGNSGGSGDGGGGAGGSGGGGGGSGGGSGGSGGGGGSGGAGGGGAGGSGGSGGGGSGGGGSGGNGGGGR